MLTLFLRFLYFGSLLGFIEFLQLMLDELDDAITPIDLGLGGFDIVFGGVELSDERFFCNHEFILYEG